MRRRPLDKGFWMILAEPAPSGLRLADAAPEDHERFGFAPQLMARLATAAIEGAILGYEVVPAEFAPRDRKRKRRRGFLHADRKAGQWSGVVSSSPAGDRLVGAGGQWSMPRVTPPPHAPAGTSYAASFWTGIDGDLQTSDVLQAGCDGDIAAGPGAQIDYKPWYEWYPGPTEWVTTLKVSQGDLLRCVLTVDPASDGRATVLLANDTTHQVVQPFAIEAPPAKRLTGNCVEWIVEGMGSLGPMALFDPVLFDACSGHTATGLVVGPAGGRLLNITDGGLPMAVAANSGVNGVQVICV